MSEKPHQCPKCQGSNFKRWQLPHPLVLHYVLNPGLAFNEIVLGQRVPAVTLICRDCVGPMPNRSYVPCPHCSVLHLGILTSGKSAFGNWRGLACPNCGQAIPCLWNVFSLLILAVTSPLWGLPYALYFRKRPLKPLYELEDGKPPAPKPLNRKTCLCLGVVWGLFMGLLISSLPWITGAPGRSWKSMLIGLPLWTLAGLGLGWYLWFLSKRVRNRSLTAP